MIAPTVNPSGWMGAALSPFGDEARSVPVTVSHTRTGAPESVRGANNAIDVMQRAVGRPEPRQPQSPAPRFAFFGPAVGRHDGWVTTQGEVLAGLFANEDYTALLSSDQLNPIRRGVDHPIDLMRWRKSVDVAVVSVFSGRAFALAIESIAVARALRIPTVAWLHGGGLPDMGSSRLRWAGPVLAHTGAVVAPTRYLARWAENFTDNPRVIPNVLDLDAYSFTPRSPLRPRLLWMRTFHELYDPATAVRTLAELRRRDIDATLTMAGQEKGLLAHTRELADSLGLSRWITFPGFVSGEAKAALFDSHDIFLNTNLVDNTPVTVLEAAASGLSIVSTNIGGIPDLLTDDRSAVLVPATAPAAMASAVARLLADPNLATRLARAARHTAEQSAWPAVRDAWLVLVTELTNNTPRHTALGRG